MSKHDKTLEKVLRGRSDSNIAFSDVRGLLSWLGFQERIRGDLHIFTRVGIIEILNLQPIRANAKAYQVKQVRELILKYQLAGDDDGI